ncbi:hypothetical protein BG011_006476, partial [Mortierella polycephala]
MTDTTTTTIATPVVEAPVVTPEVKKEETVVAAPVVEEATAAPAVAELTFSTAVEPSENPVLNADGTPLEAAPVVVVEEVTTE